MSETSDNQQPDPRKFAPAAARNRDVICQSLAPHLPSTGHVLEIASGSGEHIVHLAAAYPHLSFQPSEPDADGRASIDAWVHHTGIQNIKAALAVDATGALGPVHSVDAVICINMIHISAWGATLGLLRGAADVLKTGGFLYLYGPYKRGGEHTAPTNAVFDEDLRSRNPAWGVRDLETVTAEAAAQGFAAPIIEAMPANNLAVVFRRA